MLDRRRALPLVVFVIAYLLYAAALRATHTGFVTLYLGAAFPSLAPIRNGWPLWTAPLLAWVAGYGWSLWRLR